MESKDKENFIYNIIFWHNRIVANLMALLELSKEKLPFEVADYELLYRGARHDLDKTRPDFAKTLVAYFSVEKHTTEDKERMESYNIVKHQELCSHHVAYHKKHNTRPSDLDICEMCCDWVASSYKPYNSDLEKENKKLKEIVLNDKFKDNVDFIEPQRDKYEAVLDLIESFGLTNDFYINNKGNYGKK
jgi:uncharacterized protein (DUF608 family)